MIEVWRDIPGYEGHYQASSLGRIRSLDRTIEQAGRWGTQVRVFPGRVLRQTIRKDGYRSVNLARDGSAKTRLVHQLVCGAFHGPRPPGLDHTRHLDADRSNNRPENLKWGTPPENAADTVLLGRHRQVLKTHCPKGHPYSDENTYLQPGRVAGYRKRACAACSRERYENRRAITRRGN